MLFERCQEGVSCQSWERHPGETALSLSPSQTVDLEGTIPGEVMQQSIRSEHHMPEQSRGVWCLTRLSADLSIT